MSALRRWVRGSDSISRVAAASALPLVAFFFATANPAYMHGPPTVQPGDSPASFVGQLLDFVTIGGWLVGMTVVAVLAWGLCFGAIDAVLRAVGRAAGVLDAQGRHPADRPASTPMTSFEQEKRPETSRPTAPEPPSVPLDLLWLPEPAEGPPSGPMPLPEPVAQPRREAGREGFGSLSQAALVYQGRSWPPAWSVASALTEPLPPESVRLLAPPAARETSDGSPVGPRQMGTVGSSGGVFPPVPMLRFFEGSMLLKRSSLRIERGTRYEGDVWRWRVHTARTNVIYVLEARWTDTPMFGEVGGGWYFAIHWLRWDGVLVGPAHTAVGKGTLSWD
jgi:hypothetical protein